MEHPQIYIDLKNYGQDQDHITHDELTIIGEHAQQNKNYNKYQNNIVETIDIEDKNPRTIKSNLDNDLNQTYNELKRLYDENNFMQIMFLLPKIGKMKLIPPVFHLIIGCSMIHYGRVSSALRELGFAIYMAPTEQKRKDFLKVLAFTFADLRMTNDALSCIGEYLDLSRQNLITPDDFDRMKKDVIELHTLVLERIEQSKMNNQYVYLIETNEKMVAKNLLGLITNNSTNRQIKIQSFEDQIMSIPPNIQSESSTFLGKCRLIIQKITQSEKLLQQYQQDKFYQIVRNIINSIFIFGPTESYLQLLKMEPNLNKFCERLTIQPKRKVSVFSNSHPSSLNNNGITTQNLHILMDQIKIIKGFISMLRHEYKDAYNYFNDFEISNNQNNEDSYNKVMFLKYICQSKLPSLTRKEYELIYEKLAKIPINISLKYKTMGEIAQNIHDYEINTSKIKKSLLKSSSTNFHDLALKCYLSSVALLDEDDLYIGEHYDLILNFLVKYDPNDLRVISFFFEVRNLFVLISDYNYLHQPDLICDWSETKTNQKLLHSIQNYLENNQFLDDNDDDDDMLGNGVTNNSKSHFKQFDPISYWIKEYKKFKAESDLKIEIICKIVGYPDPN